MVEGKGSEGHDDTYGVGGINCGRAVEKVVAVEVMNRVSVVVAVWEKLQHSQFSYFFGKVNESTFFSAE